MLTRRAFLCSPSVAAFAQRPRRRPNVVVILADDQGWGDLSINGNTNVRTPHIDSIGKEGALFEHFFVCAVCAPTRAEFLTGRYHPRTGVRGVTEGQERLNLDERTIAQMFREAGYATGAFGKWHNGSQAPYHPNSRGFDEYYGFTSGHWAHYFDTEMDHNGVLTRGRGYIADDLTDHAISFIEKHRSRPFFCYLPVNTPHSPMQVPAKYFERFVDWQPRMRASDPDLEDIGMTRAALAMVENLDDNVGRVLGKIKELGLERDTVVLYFSDNGPNSWRWNGGMKGRKGSVDEGGLRSPLLMRWKGEIPAARRIPQIAAAIDLLPTLAELCGVPLNPVKALDGRSLVPLLRGHSGEWRQRAIYTLHGKRVSVRSQQFRLESSGALFDMVADPAQTRDISGQNQEVAGLLKESARQWMREVLPSGLQEDRRPYTVGYSAVTYLPARDARFSGGIQRSNKAPNSSYLTHWTSPDDRITWDVEVGESGTYDAVLHYTAPTAGSRIELSLGTSKVRATVEPAHDPPPYGMKEDRHDRGTESFAKDFKPLRLGAIPLRKGAGQLALRALQVAGSTVADVRYLTLTRR